MAELSDVAVITVGRNAGEGRDRTNTEGDFKLTEGERRTIEQAPAAFKAKNKKTVVVLNIGGSIETASWRDLPDAILLSWQGGQEAGHVVADILSGKVNPSGKLAATFVMDYMDVPSAKTFRPGDSRCGRARRTSNRGGRVHATQAVHDHLRRWHLRRLSLLRHLRGQDRLPVWLRPLLHDVRLREPQTERARVRQEGNGRRSTSRTPARSPAAK